MYARQKDYLTKSGSSRTQAGIVSVRAVVLLAFVLLLSAGIAYRLLASHLDLVVKNPIELPVALNTFPIQLGRWQGRDVPIPENIQRIAGNDDFLNRLYVDESANQWANIYIAYTSSPRTMLGHRPEVCYIGAGWIHDSTEKSHFISSGGRHIDCLIHRFNMPAPRSESIVVLNYYILNGQITADDRGFSGLSVRNPMIGGDLARYVAQVQISSILEVSTRTLARDVADLIIKYFPDVNGVVEIADDYTVISD